MNKRDVAPAAALLLLGSLAFGHLLAVPAFEDEGTHLRQISRIIEAGEWLQPLGEGKPLEVWPMVPLARLAAHPLLPIRALHVLAGIAAALLTWRLALRVQDRRGAWVSGLLVALCPFLVYLQRLALPDVLLCASGAWVLLASLRLIERATGRRAAALAAALVLTALCKLPVGFVFMGALPLAVLVAPAGLRRTLLRAPALTRGVAAHVPGVLLAVAVTVVAAVRVRHGRSPGFGLQDLLGIGFGGYGDIAAATGLARPTLLGELDALLSWPVVAAGTVGLGAAAFCGEWRARWLIAFALPPMLAIGFLADFWFSRYLLFTLPPLTIAAVCGWRALVRRAGSLRRPIEFTLLSVCVALMGHESALLVLDPMAASWSALDRFQYFEGWPSGFGYPQAARFIEHSADRPAMIYALDDHSAYQLRAYLPAPWRARVGTVCYAPNGVLLPSGAARLANLFGQLPVWIVIAEPLLGIYLRENFGPAGAARVILRPIAAFDKPGGRVRLVIYEATGH